MGEISRWQLICTPTGMFKRHFQCLIHILYSEIQCNQPVNQHINQLTNKQTGYNLVL